MLFVKLKEWARNNKFLAGLTLYMLTMILSALVLFIYYEVKKNKPTEEIDQHCKYNNQVITSISLGQNPTVCSGGNCCPANSGTLVNVVGDSSNDINKGLPSGKTVCQLCYGKKQTLCDNDLVISGLALVDLRNAEQVSDRCSGTTIPIPNSWFPQEITKDIPNFDGMLVRNTDSTSKPCTVETGICAKVDYRSNTAPADMVTDLKIVQDEGAGPDKSCGDGWVLVQGKTVDSTPQKLVDLRQTCGVSPSYYLCMKKNSI